MQTGSAQCMQALAIMILPAEGPCRKKRGLLLCVAAQARTQSSQRVQRSRSMTIVAVPLKKRVSVRKSSKSDPILGPASTAGVGGATGPGGGGGGQSRVWAGGQTERSKDPGGDVW